MMYELLPGRSPRPDAEEKFYDDIGQTIFDDIGQWLSGLKLPLIVGILTLSYGTYLTSSQEMRSTLFCSKGENTFLVLSLQWAGLLLDATIIILLWRILAWARTTKSRLRTLSVILLTSATGIGMLYSLSRFFQHSRPMSYNFRGVDSLYLFDTVIDGLMISILLVSTALLTTDGSPLSLVGIITFISSFPLAIRQALLVGTWENVSPTTTYLSMILICNGFSFFVYANNLRSVIFVHRAFIVLVLLVITLTVTTFTLIVGSKVVDGHPLERLIYDRRIDADRWLIHARVSDSLPVAIREYAERHGGRDPPPKFDAWFQFARDRNSPILDHFAQMEKDLLPFWGIAPETIREGVRRVAEEPDIILVKIYNGTLVYDPSDLSDESKSILDDLSAMIKAFGEHLPDILEFPVNLNDRPRVLAPWDDIPIGKHTGFGKLLSRRSSVDGAHHKDHTLGNHITPRAFREMTALTCPPGTKARSGVHWDIRDACASCLRPQSQGQYLTEWPMALELCHQSDLLRLHGFYMTQPGIWPLQELLPVFSRSKTSSYRDILLPLRRHDESLRLNVADADFEKKRKKLFWRGKLDDGVNNKELLQGGHQERLVHLINNATSTDEVTILLPVPKSTGKYSYEHASAAALNNLLSIDVGFIGPSDACGEDCAAARHEFGFKTDVDEDSIFSQSLLNQHVLVMDSDNGPPKDFLRVLRSGSAPFLSSIFMEWYTERLLPWVHFVPIDLRFHALHSTLSYFTGIVEKGGARLNGRAVYMEGKMDNAKWIANEGRRFASRAIRREDMEIYLFRLLLEWSRLVDDNRDKIGFSLP